MTRPLAHRGPDGEGIWLGDGVALGHRRLAIRDLSDKGRQPISDVGEQVFATYNGEIYNYDELKSELERAHGVRFRSTCDAEIIPYGYLAWGERMFDRLEGMFAIALWDTRTRDLVLGRDGVGIKPLFVSRQDGILRFASEVKAICADDGFRASVDPAGLHAFLAQGYVSPRGTLLRDVEQLPPGTIRTYFGNGRVAERQFWTPRRRPEIRTMDAALEAFAPIFGDVVRQMLVSDVPVGVAQSGGIDSSLIATTVAAERMLPLFTGSFARSSHDEVGLAAQVARALGAPHIVIPIEEELAPASTFEAVVRHFDGQVADSSAYAFFILCREMRKHVPVVLCGDGGDEFFGGYPTYRATRVASTLGLLVPHALMRGAGMFLARHAGASETRVPTREALARLLLGLGAERGEAHAEWRRLLFDHDMSALYGPVLRPLRASDPLGAYKAALRAGAGSTFDRALLADQTFYLPADLLMKVDAMSMAHAMEVRVPFLDRRIMDFAGRLDASLLNPPRGPSKRLLRVAAERFGVPHAVVRAKKMGFNTPIARLLRTGLDPLVERHLVGEVDRLAPFFNPDAIGRMLREHRERRLNHSYVLWALLTFSVWLATLGDATMGDRSGAS